MRSRFHTPLIFCLLFTQTAQAEFYLSPLSFLKDDRSKKRLSSQDDDNNVTRRRFLETLLTGTGFMFLPACGTPPSSALSPQASSSEFPFPGKRLGTYQENGELIDIWVENDEADTEQSPVTPPWMDLEYIFQVLTLSRWGKEHRGLIRTIGFVNLKTAQEQTDCKDVAGFAPWGGNAIYVVKSTELTFPIIFVRTLYHERVHVLQGILNGFEDLEAEYETINGREYGDLVKKITPEYNDWEWNSNATEAEKQGYLSAHAASNSYEDSACTTTLVWDIHFLLNCLRANHSAHHFSNLINKQPSENTLPFLWQLHAQLVDPGKATLRKKIQAEIRFNKHLSPQAISDYRQFLPGFEALNQTPQSFLLPDSRLLENNPSPHPTPVRWVSSNSYEAIVEEQISETTTPDGLIQTSSVVHAYSPFNLFNQLNDLTPYGFYMNTSLLDYLSMSAEERRNVQKRFDVYHRLGIVEKTQPIEQEEILHTVAQKYKKLLLDWDKEALFPHPQAMVESDTLLAAKMDLEIALRELDYVFEGKPASIPAGEILIQKRPASGIRSLPLFEFKPIPKTYFELLRKNPAELEIMEKQVSLLIRYGLAPSAYLEHIQNAKKPRAGKNATTSSL